MERRKDKGNGEWGMGREKGRPYLGDNANLIPRIIIACLEHYDGVVIPILL